MHTDTIAAIATALSNAGIGIIRVSGPEAISVVDSIFYNRSPAIRLLMDTLLPLIQKEIGKRIYWMR